MGINFFVNWALWEQMTFVLAGSIVLVFLAGLMKLWWINRSVRKHEILDEEKRSRLSEMRKSGLPVGKKADIPFGVRAIQSGIQVDGIWISRPGTPNSGTLAASMTLAGDSDDEPKGKERAMSSKIATPSPGQSQRPSPTASTFEQAHSPTLGPQTTYRPKHVSSRPPNRSNNHSSADLQRNSDALRNLEGASSPSRQAPQSYTPTTSFSQVRSPVAPPQGERTSSSSDEGLTLANTRHNSRMASPLTQTPQASSHERGGASRTSYFTARQTSPDDAQQRRQAATTPENEHRGVPARSYSGDVHANRSTRRVNAGFEVLPAGTFGVPSPNDDQSDLESGNSRFPPPVTNKLHKKTRSRSSSRA
ncbi:hypothetical protein PG999_013404 [Apiospora kogelbergensis]|uniref:Uncharacterized protein n=1 Tax=Apiospora kogelbergensis TaxID=1337665 RepID=A0AAW0QF61_9PEZI